MEQALAFEELFIKSNTEPIKKLIVDGEVDAIILLIGYCNPDIIKKMIVSGEGTLTIAKFISLVETALKERQVYIAELLVSWSTCNHMLKYFNPTEL